MSRGSRPACSRSSLTFSPLLRIFFLQLLLIAAVSILRSLMATTSDFRPGLTIRMDGDLWTVVEFQHVNPGNWRAFVRAKLKSLRSGKVVETRFRAGEALDVVRMETKNFQYLYHDGSGFVFMDK